MESERNALAELAERLTEIPASGLMSYDRVTIRKAQRIIVALANVKTATDLVGLIGKCHAIAEEGSEHGQ